MANQIVPYAISRHTSTVHIYSSFGENIHVFILQLYLLLKTRMNYKEETLKFPPVAIPYTDNNSINIII